jgi:predicted nucleic acid-binding Zn ribbon protein
MRRSNVQNIGELVKDLLKELHIDQKLKEIRIINSWNEILGANIQRSTSKIFIKNRVLFVYLKSPIVRNELMMMKSDIIKKLNEQAGEKVIDDLVLR